MPPDQIIIDVNVVKDWNWLKCESKRLYYQLRNWWGRVSTVKLIGDCLVGFAAVNIFRLGDYFLLGSLLATYLVVIVATSVWNTFRIKQRYENRKFNENLNNAFNALELDRLIREMRRKNRS